MLPRYDEAKGRTVLDLRSLVQCPSCGGMGNTPRMLTGLVDAGLESGSHHGRCVVQRLDEDCVLNLPEPQRSKIRLDDAQVLGRDAAIRLMRRLVGALV